MYTTMTKNDNTNYIEVEFEKELYSNLETNFRVCLCKTKTLDSVKISGVFNPLYPNYYYKIYGEFKDNKYGKTYYVNKVEVSKNNTCLALIEYFSSPLFSGIGKTTAKKIVDFLGKDCLKKIEKDFNVIDTITTITKKQRETLIEHFKNNFYQDKIFAFLMGLGLSYNASKKIFATYKFNTIEIISDNPYLLIDEIDGFGFLKCDKLALNLGIALNDEKRIKVGINYTIQEYCFSNGHTYIEYDILIKEAKKILNLDLEYYDLVEINIQKLHKEEMLVIIDDKVFLKTFYDKELNVSNKLKSILSMNKYVTKIKNVDTLINKIEVKNKITYTTGQVEVLKNIFNSRISIITGGPGTGKSTIVKGIIDLFLQLPKANEDSILLCSPTGKAAKRLNQVTNLKTYTIHKALGYDEEGFSFNENNLLPYRLIIVDEASMIDIALAHYLLRAVSLSATIIFIGDINQIPSVSPGNFLNDMITSNKIPTYFLKEVMRQVSDSNIIKLANMVLNNEVDFSKFSDNKDIFLYDIKSENYLGLLHKLLMNYKKSHNNLDDIIVLIPMYSSNVGIDKTNQYIQENFNNTKDKFLKSNSEIFYLNDKVLQLQNNSSLEIVNGDSGKIVNVIDDNLYIDFNTGKIVTYPKSNFNELTLAYSMSIHKSQGSEITNVIIPIFKSYNIMLKKKLYYTAITRAKEKLILIGDLSILKNNNLLKDENRKTYLADLLLV